MICYTREKGGKSVRQLSEMARREFLVDISARTIQDALCKGRIGESPLRSGPQGVIPDIHYKNRCTAFESFLSINQDYGDVCVCARKKLGKILQQVVYGEAVEGEMQAHHLLARVMRDTNTELKAGNVKNAEDRLIRWTNYWDISQWFNNWENDLVELGLAVHDPMSGKIMIARNQLRNIVNLDETALSLDGSTQNKGGRPEMIRSARH